MTLAATVSAQGWPGGWGNSGTGNINPWIPPWIASTPRWVPCSSIGSSCTDCNTKLVCTKFGGLQRTCTDPTLSYCNLGECSATPAEGCKLKPSMYAKTAL